MPYYDPNGQHSQRVGYSYNFLGIQGGIVAGFRCRPFNKAVGSNKNWNLRNLSCESRYVCPNGFDKTVADHVHGESECVFQRIL